MHLSNGKSTNGGGNMVLINWMPNWNLFDSVSAHAKEDVRKDLSRFIASPLKEREFFESEIPFRLSGEVYCDDRFDPGDPILTSYVKEIRFVGPGEFDVYTQNSIYHVKASDMNKAW